MRAAVTASSLNVEKRTVDVVWTTGARVLRRDWWNDLTYYEELSLDPKHVRLDRLNNGAPVLPVHNSYELSKQLGVVEPGTAKLEGKRGVATLRFSKRADVEPVFQDVQDEIIQNVSVGYRIHKLEKTEEAIGKIPVYRAVDWEPFEISFVPMGADDGAGTRNATAADTNPCELVTTRTAADVDRTRRLRLAQARAR